MASVTSIPYQVRPVQEVAPAPCFPLGRVWRALFGEDPRIAPAPLERIVGRGVIVHKATGTKTEVVIKQKSLVGLEQTFSLVGLEQTFTVHLLRREEPIGKIVVGTFHNHIETIESLARGEYKGIGTVLMQAVIEYKLRTGLVGTIGLNAVSSQAFHEKMGFCESRKGRYSTFMEMPPSQLAQWCEKIKRDPLFFPPE